MSHLMPFTQFESGKVVQATNADFIDALSKLKDRCEKCLALCTINTEADDLASAVELVRRRFRPSDDYPNVEEVIRLGQERATGFTNLGQALHTIKSSWLKIRDDRPFDAVVDSIPGLVTRIPVLLELPELLCRVGNGITVRDWENGRMVTRSFRDVHELPDLGLLFESNMATLRAIE
jgi:hypothetical protein